MRPAAKAALAAEIATQYVALRHTLRSRNVDAALARARARGRGREAPDPVSARQIGLRLARAVDRTLRALPADSRCIMQALVLCSLLARRGIPTSLVIGVRDPRESFLAHAWVELEGAPLQPTADYPRLVEL
jgi:hypothetical protein